jgi:hypothetical protein
MKFGKDTKEIGKILACQESEKHGEEILRTYLPRKNVSNEAVGIGHIMIWVTIVYSSVRVTSIASYRPLKGKQSTNNIFSP